jgi:16S rRNA processing protein RimM
MREPANMLPVARIVKSFGDDGRVLIRLSSQTKSDIKTKDPVFIFFDELPVPFFILEMQPKGNNQILVRIEGIENWQQSEEICGEIVYVERKSKKNTNSKQDSPEEGDDLIGYKIKSFDNSFEGEVSNFYDFANNPCLGVQILENECKGEEKLIPLAQEFIVSVNTSKREIVVKVPEGLFNI